MSKSVFFSLWCQVINKINSKVIINIEIDNLQFNILFSYIFKVSLIIAETKLHFTSKNLIVWVPDIPILFMFFFYYARLCKKIRRISIWVPNRVLYAFITISNPLSRINLNMIMICYVKCSFLLKCVVRHLYL